MTPDGTVTGPVGGTTGAATSAAAPAGRAPARASWRGRAAPVSITTRRLRRPAGRPGGAGSGGLVCSVGQPFALSVEPRELRIDPHGLSQGAVEGVPVAAPARSRPAAGTCRRRVPAPCGECVSAPSRATKRSSSACGALRPQPAHVRIGRAHAAGSDSSAAASRHRARALGAPPPAGSVDAVGGRCSSASGLGELGSRPRASGSDSATTGSSSWPDGSSRAVRAAPGARGRRSSASPGSAAFGQRLPFERIAAQRPVNSCRPRRRRRRRRPRPPRRELGVGLDVDLPAGQARGEAGVQALLADRERELVVRDDDGRLLACRRRRRPRARGRATAPWRRSGPAPCSTG